MTKERLLTCTLLSTSLCKVDRSLGNFITDYSVPVRSNLTLEYELNSNPKVVGHVNEKQEKNQELTVIVKILNEPSDKIWKLNFLHS